jgi:hypothetical protein
MSVSSERPLSRDRAWSCIMMNIATPGVGSMRAGQILTGLGQLLFALGGAALICVWIIKMSYGLVQEELGASVPQSSSGWMWKWGSAGFAVSYVWTFVTCVNLYRRAEVEERQNPGNAPPRLADLPGKDPEKH